MPILTSHVRQHVKQLLSEVDQRIEYQERRDTLRTVYHRVDRIAESTEADELKIRRNAHLTPEGRRAQLRDLVTKKAGELKFLQDELGKINTSHQNVSNVLYSSEGQRALDEALGRHPERIEPDAVVRYLRAREIRDAVRPMLPHERDILYLKAIEGRDQETVRALSNAPGGPLVSADMKRRADHDYAERQFPEAFQNLAQISAVQDQLQGLNDLTSRWLVDMGTQP